MIKINRSENDYYFEYDDGYTFVSRKDGEVLKYLDILFIGDTLNKSNDTEFIKKTVDMLNDELNGKQKDIYLIGFRN